MTRAMMGWRKGWRGGQWLGGDIFSGECYSDHELEAHVLLFDTIFFFLLSNSYFLSLSLSLFHIFSLSLSLFHSEALRDTKMFSTETSYVHQSIPTKGQNIKIQQMQKRCWNGRGERAKLSLPLLCTFVHNLNGEKFTRALVHARQMQQGGTFSVS